jgi:hypothetical protein
LRLLPLGLHGGAAIVADKGYAGREFEQAVADRFGATLVRPRRADEPGPGPQPAPIRQLIESIFWTSRIASRSNCTAPARSSACATGSLRSCSRWPPASGSTTSSGGRRAFAALAA